MRDKNIHDELLPEGYQFSEEDEKRLDEQDFYTHRTGELPAFKTSEADRFMAWRWYGNFMKPMDERFLGAMAWRISRERQLLKTADLLHEVSTDADPAGTVRELAVARDTIKAQEVLIQELRAEVARLKGE